MNLGPQEKFVKFSELTENRALKPFAHFCVQPAAPGLKFLKIKWPLNLICFERINISRK